MVIYYTISHDEILAYNFPLQNLVRVTDWVTSLQSDIADWARKKLVQWLNIYPELNKFCKILFDIKTYQVLFAGIKPSEGIFLCWCVE